MMKKMAKKEMKIEDLAKLIRVGFAGVDKRFGGVDKRFDTVDKRFEIIDKRFDSTDKKFAEVDKSFIETDSKIDNKIDELARLMVKHFGRVDERLNDHDKGFELVTKELHRLGADMSDVKVTVKSLVPMVALHDRKISKLEEEVGVVG